ncbi:hypothetical protein KIPB_007401, partial [Kipferlia bialata]
YQPETKQMNRIIQALNKTTPSNRELFWSLAKYAPVTEDTPAETETASEEAEERDPSTSVSIAWASAFTSKHDPPMRDEGERVGEAEKEREEQERKGKGIDMGVFAICGRLKHSCVPNTSRTWLDAGRVGSRLIVRAACDIAEGTELTTSYIDMGQVFAKRQKELEERHSIRCTCPCCSQMLDKMEDSDKRRDTIQRTHRYILDQVERKKMVYGPTTMILKKLPAMIQAEYGDCPSVLMEHYRLLFRVHMSAGYVELARDAAYDALEQQILCHGYNKECEEWVGYCKDPQSHEEARSQEMGIATPHARKAFAPKYSVGDMETSLTINPFSPKYTVGDMETPETLFKTVMKKGTQRRDRSRRR